MATVAAYPELESAIRAMASDYNSQLANGDSGKTNYTATCTDLNSDGGEENITWYQSSEKVRRGFCSTCGSSLFWDSIQNDKIAVAIGALDGPSGTQLAMHIFTSEKGDYYSIADGVTQH